ncbi:hypothetical protein [Geoalkalibacter halelectricus]|uniref:hypothetical protein n=1 Tax=Geoalkalibacter halelectricus TaxID=2847045 RepID=UPI00266EE156|nr:hypothetical protein [Geoalkalibacter halelectricus]MDO3376981.1 hypothetical protein [Geoalkalibacter halelectricus]
MSDETRKPTHDEEEAQIVEPSQEALREQGQETEEARLEPVEEPTTETTEEPAQEKAEEQTEASDQYKSEEHEPFKDKTEKFWDVTRKTLALATFKAGQYRRIVQKKIDLASLHKKISAAHGDLGRIIDEAHEAGVGGILDREDVKNLFERLDEYKQNAAVLEHEIEMIKAEEPEEKHPQE